jgi:hypothetical protein
MKQSSTTPAPLFMTTSDVHALADRLEVRGTNRAMRHPESLHHDLRLAAEAIRALLRDRAPSDQIICDES